MDDFWLLGVAVAAIIICTILIASTFHIWLWVIIFVGGTLFGIGLAYYVVGYINGN